MRYLLEVPDDDENAAPIVSGPAAAARQYDEECERSFMKYIKGDDEIPEGMSLVEWWGVIPRLLLHPRFLTHSCILTA